MSSASSSSSSHPNTAIYDTWAPNACSSSSYDVLSSPSSSNKPHSPPRPPLHDMIEEFINGDQKPLTPSQSPIPQSSSSLSASKIVEETPPLYSFYEALLDLYLPEDYYGSLTPQQEREPLYMATNDLSLLPVGFIDALLTHLPTFLSPEIMPASELYQREMIVQVIEDTLQPLLPKCQVHLFGSSGSTFCFSHSDVDACVVYKEKELESGVVVMNKIRALLCEEHFELLETVLAKVPIIRLIHSKSRIQVDLSVNNALAVTNTQLLRTYASIDPRVLQLGLAIKLWAQCCGISSASDGYLSSYSWILLTIYYLQKGSGSGDDSEPHILPNLQSPYAGVERRPYTPVDPRFVSSEDDLSYLRMIASNNKKSLKQLFFGFFDFYATDSEGDRVDWKKRFDWHYSAVSIRLGADKELRLDNGKGTFPYIEDPFEIRDLSLVARREYRTILHYLYATRTVLHQNRDSLL